MAAAQQQYLIDTIAGGPPQLTPHPAESAAIGFAISVAADAKGNVYFASADLNSVFRLDANGTVIRIAGNTIAGFTGDGGQATNAQLNLSVSVAVGSPGGLALDSAGNLFIADTGNNRIRRVSPSGVITTVAGPGKNSSYGEGGPAVDPDLRLPTGIALDSEGNLFVSERGSNRVRKISTSGIITTVAGSGNGGYGGDGGPAVNALLAAPAGLTVDASGNLYIADSYNNRVRRVSPEGIITTFAGGGPAYGAPGIAELPFPVGVALNDAGNLLVLQLIGGSRVLEFSADGTLLRTVAGSGRAGFSGDGGPAASAQLLNPFAMALDTTGSLYIADTANYRIRKISRDGTINTVAGSGGGGFLPQQDQRGDGGPVKGAPLVSAWGVAVGSKANLFIADASDNRIRKVSPDGIISTVAGTGARGFSGDNGPAINAQLNSPFGLTLDGAGNLFFIDAYNYRIRKISADGIINTIAGSGKMGFSGDGGPATSAMLNDFSWCNTLCGGLAIDRGGNLFIADPGSDRVRKVSPDGIITTVAGNGTVGSSGDSGRATDAQLRAPTGVAIDTSGNLFIADGGAGSIRRVSPDGTISTVVSSGLSAPSGVAIDDAGNLFVADPGWNFYAGDVGYQVCCDQRVVKVSPDRTITAVAGDGHSGYSGDGGPAVTAWLNGPVSVAVDGAGNVYVADVGNRAIRLLHPTGRSVLIGAVVDAASQQTDPVSPGKIVVVYGAGLGPSQLIQNLPTNDHMSSELSGTTVAFNSNAAPILYTSATQVATVVPYAVSGSTARVTVTYQGQASADFVVPVASASPGVFTSSQAGSGQALAINVADGTVNSPNNPVKIGEYISLYATGEGQTVPGGADGQVGSSSSIRPRLPVNVTVGGIAATVQYAGGAPGQIAGLMQVNVQIPSGVRAGGYVPVVLQVGDSSTVPGAVWIAVSAN
jgi:uncharacterized protein (TIGR03437 family)